MSKYKIVRKLDKFDMEAEAEGNSIRFMKKNAGAGVVGRRILKQRNGESRGASIAGNKRVTTITKDQVKVMKEYCPNWSGKTY